MNKNLFNNSNVIIHFLIKETINYKNVIFTINNLRFIFKDLIKKNHNLLINNLLLSISNEKYFNLILKEFFKIKDKNNLILYLYFKDLYPNKQNNNNWLFNKVFNNNSLRNRFFSLKNDSFIIDKSKIKVYFNKVLLYKKRNLIIIYLITRLPNIISYEILPYTDLAIRFFRGSI